MCIVFVPGVLKESQQWEVYTEGPASCTDAEGPQVPSAPSGGRSNSFEAHCDAVYQENISKENRLFQEISP